VAARPPSIIAVPPPASPGSGRRRPARPRPGARPGRRPFRDNPQAILASIALLAAALVATLYFANRSARFAPDFLTEFVLYALSIADLTMLVALGFVLARNIVKLIVERRRALPLARFRAKLVGVLLGMTLLPAGLVLFVGSELILNSVDRWFNQPMEEVLSAARGIAADYYEQRQTQVRSDASRLARTLAGVPLTADQAAGVRDAVSSEVTPPRVGAIDLIDVYRVSRGAGDRVEVTSIVEVANPTLPPYNRASAVRLAERVAAGGSEAADVPERLAAGGDLIRAAAPVKGPDGATTGVVVAGDYLTGELTTRARQMTEAFESYSQMLVLKRPLTGVYLSFYLMVTLMIMVAATWIGLYLAKRVTRPIRRLEAAAREIGAGHFDHRVEPETVDEFGALAEAFNAMAHEVSTSQRKLERSAVDLGRKNREVEARRRFIETILQRIATGVISIDEAGVVTAVNAAAARLLGLPEPASGQRVDDLLGRPDLEPLAAFLGGAGHDGFELPAQEIALVLDGRELHLAVARTTLVSEAGDVEGTVLVFDDITPLIRAQKVAAWREIARRLAHEIKNPLTPIQLCAQRIRRHFAAAPPATRALVDECTATIVGEVESLKSLVDEFSQFARMPAPRRVPADLGPLVEEALALYNGLFQEVRLVARLAPDLPRVLVDPEQVRRILINLVDNAIEAMDRRGEVVVATEHDRSNQVVRLTVTDTGPGIPAADRERLFMPYFSTKRRGSGLGLAIVRRIVLEHGGSIEVTDNAPRGTRFTIDLPCA